MLSNKLFRRITNSLAKLTVSALILSLVGCGSKTDALLINSKSPDGAWSLSAENEDGGSFGTSYDITNVYLTRIIGNKEKTRILSFSHEYNTMTLEAKWLNDKNLEIYYGGVKGKFDAVVPGFVAVKLADVNISTVPISN